MTTKSKKEDLRGEEEEDIIDLEEEEEDDLEEEEIDEKKNEDSEEEEEEEEEDLEEDLEEDDLDGDLEDADEDAEYLEEDKKEKRKKKIDKKKEEDLVSNFSEKDYDSEEDTDEEDEDDSMLQKFNENLNMKFLEDIHVETKSVNYDEMIALSRVVRDKNGKIIDPLHKTLPFLTKYEKARIIGARAEQLDRGGEAFIPLDENIINGRTIALMEFEAKKIPFIIARPLPNGSIEYWNLRDLEIL